MTIETNQNTDKMDQVTVRIPRALADWLERLVEEGYFHNRAEAWREAGRRVAHDPEALWSVARTWHGPIVERPGFRCPPELLERVNDLDREGLVQGTTEAFRIGLAVVADDYLEDVQLSTTPGAESDGGEAESRTDRADPDAVAADEGWRWKPRG